MATNIDGLDSLFEGTDLDPNRNPLPAETGAPDAESLIPKALQPIPEGPPGGSTDDAFRQELIDGILPEADTPGVGGEFLKGVSRGATQIVSDAPLIGSTLADIFGAEETANELATLGLEIQKGGEEAAPQAVDFDQAFDGPGNFVKWLAGAVGEQVPVLASIFVTGGIGTGLFKLAARGAAARAASNMAAKQIARRAATRGFATGAFAGATGLETAGIAGESFGATGEVNGAVALVGGAAAGALETLTPLAISRATGLTIGQAGGFLEKVLVAIQSGGTKRAGKIASMVAAGAFTEAATELGQESIAIAARDFVDENFSALDPSRQAEIYSRLLESAVTGGFVGGGLTAISSPFIKANRETLDPLERLRLDLEELEGTAVADGTSAAFALGVPTVDVLAEDQTRTELASQTREFLNADGEVEETLVTTEFTIAQDFVDKVVREAEGGQQLPVDINNATKFRIQRGRLDPETTSVLLRDVPLAFDLNDPRVRFVREGGQVEAAEHIQRAINAYTEGDFAGAQESYTQALSFGFRYVPTARQSFVVVGAVPESALTTEQGAINIPDGMFTSRGLSTQVLQDLAAGNIDAGAVTVLADAGAGREGPLASTAAAKDSGRNLGAFFVDARRLDDAQMLNMTPHDFRLLLEAEGVDFGKLDDDALGDTLSPEGMREVVEKLRGLPGVRLEENLTDANVRAIYRDLEIADVRENPLSFQRKLEDTKLQGLTGLDPVKEQLAIIGAPDRRALFAVPWAPIFQKRSKRDLGSTTDDDIRKSLDEINYDPFAQQEDGTAALVEVPNAPTSGQNLAIGKKLEKLYNELMKEFGITDRRLVLHIASVTGMPVGGGTQGSHRSGNNGRLGQINIDPTLSEETLVSVAMHEFGHFIIGSKWAGLDSGMRKLILRGYNRALLKGFAGRGSLDFKLEFLSNDRLDAGSFDIAMLNDVPVGFPHRLEGMPDFFNMNEGYWLSFDEWFADQTSRWAQGTKQGQGFIEKYFATIGAHLQKVIEAFKQVFPFLRDTFLEPNDTFVEFLDYLKARPEQTAGVNASVVPLEEQRVSISLTPLEATYFRDILSSTTNLEDLLAAAPSARVSEDYLSVAIGDLEALDGWIQEGINLHTTEEGRLPPRFRNDSFILKLEAEERALRQRAESNFGPQSQLGALYLAEEPVAENAANQSEPLPGAQTEAPTEFTSAVRRVLQKLGIRTPNTDAYLAAGDRFNKLMEIGYTLQQVARLNPEIKGLQVYRELVERWASEKRRLIGMADQTARDWSDLGQQQGDAVGKLLFAMDAMEYLTNEEVEAETMRLPTEAEERVFAERFGVDTAGWDMYQRIKKQFQDILTDMEEATIKATIKKLEEDAAKDPAGAGVILGDVITVETGRIRKEFSAFKQTPYFPHMRFGNFGVRVADSEGTVIAYYQFVTEREAKAAAKVLHDTRFPSKKRVGDTGAAHFGIRIGKIPDVAKPMAGLPPSMLKALGERLNLSKEQRVELDNYIAEHLPTRSFAKRLLRRKNIPGFSEDAMQAYAAYFFHGANYLARLKWGGTLQDAIVGMEDEARALSKELELQGISLTTRRDEIISFAQDHLGNIMDPKPDFAEWRAFAFLWHLGFNPKSAFINLTQVPMVTWPYLSAKFGSVKAFSALQKAAVDFNKSWARTVGEEETRTDPFYVALNLAMEQGFLDESMAKELAELAEGSNLKRLMPGTAAGRTLRMVNHWSAFLFQTSEKWNRSLTFRAAYDLAIANPEVEYLNELVGTNPLQVQELLDRDMPMNQIKAFLAAKDAVLTTQFNYQAEARPWLMRGKRATLLTFFMFKQNMLFFAAHVPGRGKYLLSLLFLAGMMGMPGADDLSGILKLLGRQLFGKNFDLEQETRELVLNVAGEGTVNPDLILHGISRYGFGLPALAEWTTGVKLPSFDLSGSIGQGSFVPGLSGVGDLQDFDRKLSESTQDIAGASFGVPFAMASALADSNLPIDDFKRWERAMPAALRSLSRTYRFAAEGRERNRAGATVEHFNASDPHDLVELIAIGLGFQPTRLSQKWSREIAKIEKQNYWAFRRGMLLRQFDQAAAIAPGPARSDVLAAIKRFNRTVPYGGLAIRGDDIRQSLRERVITRKMFELGIGGGRRQAELNRGVNETFPEVEELSRRR